VRRRVAAWVQKMRRVKAILFRPSSAIFKSLFGGRLA
jgi:hypothetical protein